MSETIDNTSRGALPSLNSGGDVLGKPTSALKSKTNVGKFWILALVLVGFVFIIGGLLLYQKYRHASTTTESVAKNEPVKHGLASKNTAVESDSIDKAKAEIKKKQAEEQAQIKAIEEIQAQAQQAQAKVIAEAEAAQKGKFFGGQQPSAQNQQQVNQPTPQTPLERKMTSGVLLDSTGAKPKSDAQFSEKDQQQREVQARLASAGVQQGGNPSFGGDTSRPPQQSGGSQGNDGLASRLQPTVLQARSAGKLPNLDYLLKRGTTIPCALKTGIDTTLPGFVICSVLNNVYSANGKVLLIERGATVFGEQQSSLKQGQERTFVVWSRIDNPNGVFANIDSPATDQMGYSGIPGFVDTHFWQRFGGAIMLSLIKDFSQAYAQRAAGTGSNTAALPYSNTTQSTQEMASEALRNSINIAPTLVVNPATVVSVMVARDVSFESVYEIIE